jgi:hypothetical protein
LAKAARTKFSNTVWKDASIDYTAKRRAARLSHYKRTIMLKRVAFSKLYFSSLKSGLTISAAARKLLPASEYSTPFVSLEIGARTEIMRNGRCGDILTDPS